MGGRHDINQRRLRANRHIRELTATVSLSPKDFIQPLFVDQSVSGRTAISTLSGIYSDTEESVIRQIESDLKNGVSKFLLFPVPAGRRENDFDFSFAVRTIKRIKAEFGDSIWLASDVCLCSYTSHGHCGVLSADRNKVLNHETAEVLADYALQLAEAGADCIAPSDLMDGRVRSIRTRLDQNGFDHLATMSYSAKFSSAYYGPFRDACKSAPEASGKLHDRKTYQLSPFNSKDAIQTALRDIEEGTDIVMIKPALLNLDILQQLSELINSPLAAYHVSGEYQGIELLADQGIIARDKGHIEVWTSLKRGGATCIISYASRFAREWILQIEY